MLLKNSKISGVINPLSEEAHSSGNKYVACNIENKVARKEYMYQLDHAIRTTKYVCMVL